MVKTKIVGADLIIYCTDCSKAETLPNYAKSLDAVHLANTRSILTDFNNAHSNCHKLKSALRQHIETLNK